MIRCFWCELELDLTDAFVGPKWQEADFAICKDRILCRERRKNGEVKEAFLAQCEGIKEAREELAHLYEVDNPGLCSICEKVGEHEYHRPVKCSWCKCFVEFVPCTSEEIAPVNGWCPECKASWLLEIERDMR